MVRVQLYLSSQHRSEVASSLLLKIHHHCLYAGMAIWEPCNFVSNLAYDRLVVELCNQSDWTLSEEAIKKIAEAYAILTFGSSFW